MDEVLPGAGQYLTQHRDEATQRDGRFSSGCHRESPAAGTKIHGEGRPSEQVHAAHAFRPVAHELASVRKLAGPDLTHPFDRSGLLRRRAVLGFDMEHPQLSRRAGQCRSVVLEQLANKADQAIGPPRDQR